MRTLPVWVVVMAAFVATVASKEKIKDAKVELQPHSISRRTPGRGRPRSYGGSYRYDCLTCASRGGGYNYGHNYSGGYSYGGGRSQGRHSGGRSRRGRGRYSGGRSRGGRGRHSGGRSRGGRHSGGRSRGGRHSGSSSSRGSRHSGGRSYGGSSYEYGYGSRPSCRCPFLTSGSGRWGSGGTGGIGNVEFGGTTQSQNSGYYRQWFQAFSNHPCCAGQQGLITSYQRTRPMGYGQRVQ